MSGKRLAILLPAFVLLWLGPGCAKKRLPLRPTPDIPESPRIFPPPIPQVAMKGNPQALPKDARPLFPAFDGDGMFVSLPAREAGKLSARQVFSEVIVPVLSAIGFENPSGRIRVPDYDGRDMPRGDLAALASITCAEITGEQMPGAREMCTAMQTGKATPAVDRMMLGGEGMTFQQFRADIERLEILYFFPQVEKETPIEHTGIVAVRRDGETVTVVTGRVLNRFVVTNQVKLKPEEAAGRVLAELVDVNGVCCPQRQPPKRVELLLLPYGNVKGMPGLKYSYRMPVRATYKFVEGIFYVWLDAETGKILELQPLVDADVAASGKTFRRDPGTLPAVQARAFRVDNSAGGNYTLQLTGVFSRLDRLGDADFNDGEVAIADNANGSSAVFANFDQAPLNDAANAVCAAGGNTTFEQVDLMATLSTHRLLAINAGLFTPFPAAAMTISFENNFCNAFGSPAGLSFGFCTGYTDAACPNLPNQFIITTHDHSWVAHELGHALTPRQYTDRPADWCVGPTLEGVPAAPCPVPTGQSLFHDFADSWAHAFENTNCWSGWFSKNQGGPDASRNCIANHSEGGFAPRLSQVNVPFDPATPGDHFPEHRTLATGGYADMQIAGAALWAIRQGMRSKCLPSGTPQYLVRFVRALRTTGWFGTPSPVGDDKGVYRGLLDLAVKMANQWATSGSPGGPPAFHHNGPHTTSKVTAGFARAGIFLIPVQCIDGDNATTDATFCPAGENGGDAVVDIDDNDPADDVTIDAILHPEWDYLERGGAAPTFHVWTGPTYVFSGSTATFPNPAPCNRKFQVEVANDDTFTTNLRTSGWINVDVNPNNAVTPECYGTWTIPAGDWNTLDDGERLFYRVRTRDQANGNERVSTSPGLGLFNPPPPYAVINVTGTP